MVYNYIIQHTIMFNNIIPLLYGIYTNGILLLWFMVYNVQLIGFFSTDPINHCRSAEDADLKKLGADLRAGLQQMIDNILKAERWGAVDESMVQALVVFGRTIPKWSPSFLQLGTATHVLRPKN